MFQASRHYSSLLFRSSSTFLSSSTRSSSQKVTHRTPSTPSLQQRKFSSLRPTNNTTTTRLFPILAVSSLLVSPLSSTPASSFPSSIMASSCAYSTLPEAGESAVSEIRLKFDVTPEFIKTKTEEIIAEYQKVIDTVSRFG